MKTQTLRRVAAAAALAVSSFASQAATVITALPDFNGTLHNSGFPIDLGVVGTFNYALPSGATITSATFSGTYGTQQFSGSTAGFDVEIEGDSVTVCVVNTPCWNGSGPFAPFSFALDASTFAGLSDGSADLRVSQTSGFFVRLGTPTLTIEYELNAVPVPASFTLAGLGLLALAATPRRRRQA